MLTNKKRLGSWSGVFLLLLSGLLLAGCTPPGPKALLDGKKLLEQGKYDQAIDKLTTATSLMSTNAQAWNYLGLAQHHARQTGKAIESYRRALRQNPDLVIVYYNLGNLYLEQNRPDLAKNELTAFTVRQNNSADGWVKLGTAQLKLREIAGAEKSFNEALRLNPQDPEALNNQGMVYQQKGRPQDAANYFAAALKQQPNYAPALFNLAVIYHTQLNNREFALQKYQEYLALQPRPSNSEAVVAIAGQLAQEFTSSPRTSINLASVPSGASLPGSSKPQVTNAVRTANTVINTPKAESPTNTTRVAAVQDARMPVQTASAIVKPETVKVQETPEVKQAQDVAPAQPSQSQRLVSNSNVEQRGVAQPANGTASTQKQEKRGFFQKFNPANLFKGEEKATTSSTTTAAIKSGEKESSNAGKVAQSATPINYPRYPYRSPAKPAAGNRANATRLYTQAVQAHKDRRTSEALELYKAAIQADPGLFEAQSSLGSIAYETSNMGLSLYAYETALAIKPDSFNARFNFALTLKKSGYAVDAAQELERVLAGSSDEPPAHQAAAHLMLANIYAEQLRRPDVARPHYSKVLELDPQNSQATAVRYWLRDNP